MGFICLSVKANSRWRNENDEPQQNDVEVLLFIVSDLRSLWYNDDCQRWLQWCDQWDLSMLDSEMTFDWRLMWKQFPIASSIDMMSLFFEIWFDDDDVLVKLFVSEEWLKCKSKHKLKNELQAKVADDAAWNLTCCCRAKPSIKMSGARTSLGENITKVFGTRRVWDAESQQNLKLSNVTILLWGVDTALCENAIFLNYLDFFMVKFRTSDMAMKPEHVKFVRLECFES